MSFLPRRVRHGRFRSRRLRPAFRALWSIPWPAAAWKLHHGRNRKRAAQNAEQDPGQNPEQNDVLPWSYSNFSKKL